MSGAVTYGEGTFLSSRDSSWRGRLVELEKDERGAVG